MRVTPVNFKGIYNECISCRNMDEEIKNELDNARPYLEEVAKALPYGKVLSVDVYGRRDGDTHLDVDYFDMKTKESYTLTRKTEHDVFGYGFDILNSVFRGLREMDKNVFEETAKNFVLSFERIQNKLHPLNLDGLDDYP